MAWQTDTASGRERTRVRPAQSTRLEAKRSTQDEYVASEQIGRRRIASGDSSRNLIPSLENLFQRLLRLGARCPRHLLARAIEER